MLEPRPRGPGHLIDKKVLRYACHIASCFLTPLGKPDFVAQGCLVKAEPEVGGSGWHQDLKCRLVHYLPEMVVPGQVSALQQ